jgi:hypothetical protein
MNVLAAVVLAPAVCCGASLWEQLGLSKGKGTNVAAGAALLGLSEEQVTRGLKEALGKGVEQAVGMLGKEGGFLNDLSVKILMPEKLKKAESTLRTLGQGRAVDDFIASMNRGAEKAAPEAAAVLGDAIRQMTVADAKAILTGTNNAATQYFRRTSETNLYDKFLPIVKKATDEVGVTSSYKRLVDKAGFAAPLLNAEAANLDGYVTRKALDGLFLKIGEEEKRIRENPAARTTDLLQKVFGAVTK